MFKKLYLFFLVLLYSVNASAQIKPSNDNLHWHSERKLLWTDFKGEAIEGIGLKGEIFCIILANYEKPNAFVKTSFLVIALFDKTKSWNNPKIKTVSGLMYFQTIFNIYEVNARRLRNDFSETKFGTNLHELFQEKYNNSMTLLTDEFNQYRKETKMGMDTNALKEWNVKVDGELIELEKYKE